MLLLAFPCSEGSSCCLGSGDWPLDPHEILLHPQDLEHLRVPGFGYVAVNRNNGSVDANSSRSKGGCHRRSAAQVEHSNAAAQEEEEEERQKPLAYCRAVPDDSLAPGETRAPAWLLSAAGVQPRQHLSISRPSEVQEAEKLAAPLRGDDQEQHHLLRVRVDVALKHRQGEADASAGDCPSPAGNGDFSQNVHSGGYVSKCDSRAIARRVSGCMVRDGSLLAAEVLGETVLLQVTAISCGNDDGGDASPVKRPLIINSGTEVALMRPQEPERSRSPPVSWDGQPVSPGGEQSRRRRRPRRRPQLQATKGCAETWARQAPGLEAALSELRALVLLSVGGNSGGAWSGVLPAGVALCGPSGVGKTLSLDLLAEDLSENHGIHVIRLLGPQILAGSGQGGGRGGVGGGTRASAVSSPLQGPLGLALSEARARAPSVLVFDELDALFDACGGDEGGDTAPLGEGARANAALLEALDRASAIEGVAVLGATRRSPGGKGGAGWAGLEEGEGGGRDGAALPAAFRKPGRFDRCVTIGPPTQAQRERILSMVLSTAAGAAELELEPLATALQARPVAGSTADEMSSGKPVVIASRDAPDLEPEREPTTIFADKDDARGGRGGGRGPSGGAERKTEDSNSESTEAGAAAAAIAAEWAKRLSSLTPGMVGGDLERLVRTARARSLQRGRDPAGQQTTQPSPPRVLMWGDAMAAVAITVPRSLQGLDVASTGSGGEGGGGGGSGPTWSSVGGFSEAKRRLQRLVQWPWLHPEAFARMGVSAPAGALLYGPSGCGKSLVAQVLATECLANFLWVRSSELLSRYLGETEAKLRALFSRARAAAPCILFLDELDAITAKRGDGGGGDEGEGGGGAGSVHARVLSTLLNEMDGVACGEGGGTSASWPSPTGGGGVLVLAATNRRGALDAALLRPGRLHESVELGFPGKEDREGVLRVHAGRLPRGAAGIDLARLSQDDVSGGLTCADLEAACRDAAMMAVREDLHGAREVRPEHLRKALKDRVAGRLRTRRFTFSIGQNP
ncbi:unnamed protein product [Ectocarpus sp. CCAP 1310/34]|nr:unnamed protein product [Ectocarpus sp. CCAP 1310/34]